MKNKIQSIFNRVTKALPEVKPEWMFDFGDKRKFFIMHIPKTGGTTFRKMINRHSPEGYLWPDQQFLTNNGLKYPKQKDLFPKHKVNINSPILIGHYNLDVIKELDKDIIILAFFRNPYERILSHLKHVCAVNKSYNNDPNKVLEKNFKQIQHVQSRMLRYQPLNKKGFDKMQQNFHKIHFVGITEEFNRSINLCNKMFNWKLDIIEPQNRRPVQINEKLSEENKSKIIKELTPEIETYNIAYMKFTNLCEEFNI